jgi:hypothetical protein
LCDLGCREGSGHLGSAYNLYCAAHGIPTTPPLVRVVLLSVASETQEDRMPSNQLHEPIPRLQDHPALATINQLCRSLSLVQKKEIMTAVRVGLAPRRSRRLRRNGTLGKMRRDTVTLLDTYGNEKETITMQEVWLLLDSFLSTPMRRSLLSMALRCSFTCIYLESSDRSIRTLYMLIIILGLLIAT